MRSVMSDSFPEQLSRNLEFYVPLQPERCEKITSAIKISFGSWKDEEHQKLQGGVEHNIRSLRKSTRSRRAA